jgi:thymidine phosphorylase
MTTTIALIITALVLTIAGLAVHIWNLSNDNDKLRADISRNFYDEMLKSQTRYRTIYEFINVENAGDNMTLNKKVKMLQDNGYNFDKQASQNGLLVFAKNEKIQEGEK